MTDPRTLAVLTDLAQEGDWLEGMVVGLSEDDWRRPTPARMAGASRPPTRCSDRR